MAATGGPDDPYVDFVFAVEIEGITVAAFSECLGLDSEAEAFEYRNGDENITARKIPGLRKSGKVTLKRGVTDNKDLWEWRLDVARGVTNRKSGTIILLNEGVNHALEWRFLGGWPSRWAGPHPSPEFNATAIDILEISFEVLQQV